MFPMDYRPMPVAVEYDAARGRRIKLFNAAIEARRFYAFMDKQSRHPTVTRSDVMSPEVVTEPTTPVAKPKAKPKAKPPKAKPKAKKVAAKKPDLGHNPIRWSEKKIELLRALRRAGALNPQKTITKEEIAKISGNKALTGLSPNYDLSVQNFIAMAQVENSRKYTYYITAKGLEMLGKLLSKTK